MMPQAARDPKRLALLVGLLIVAAVLFRSVFFLEFDESYFDSDQAIVGLMAKHLVEGRALPLFFYGQEYMLGVESWVMAPFFAVLGPTVFALRLTMVFLNAVTALLLWRLLVVDARLNVWLAALAASPFVIAPFVTAAHLLEAQGGNVEPFFWVLLAWTLREKPLALGAVLAVAFLNREFSAYAVPALLVLQFVAAGGRVMPLVRPWVLTGFAFLVVFQGVNALKPYADLMGPGSAGVPVAPAAQDNVSLLLARANVDRSALPSRFRALATEHLPMVVGLDGFRPHMLSIGTDAARGLARAAASRGGHERDPADLAARRPGPAPLVRGDRVPDLPRHRRDRERCHVCADARSQHVHVPLRPAVAVPPGGIRCDAAAAVEANGDARGGWGVVRIAGSGVAGRSRRRARPRAGRRRLRRGSCRWPSGSSPEACGWRELATGARMPSPS